MSEERTKQALARIDVALARIEAVAYESPPPPASGALSALQARHSALKASTGEALSALEGLISMRTTG
jgi:hypothetical protein